MKCKQIEKIFSGFVDGELDETSKRAFMQHLEGCENCSLAMEQYRKIDATVANAAADIVVPEKLDQRAMEIIRLQRCLETRRPFRYGWAAATVSLVLALLFGMMYLKQKDTNLEFSRRMIKYEESLSSSKARIENMGQEREILA